MSTVQTSGDKQAEKGGKKILEKTMDRQWPQASLVRTGDLELSKELAKSINSAVGKRTAVPVRKSFVRNDNIGEDAPLKRLVSTGGRGAAVSVMLYIALIWKSAKKPFDSSYSAKKWAELLALPEPTTKGARRVANAMKTLEQLKLIEIERCRGDVSKITLLDESGDGSGYELPSTAYSRGGLNRDLYFKVSSKLWLSGTMQQLSAPGLAMLLILQSEGGAKPTTNGLLSVMGHHGEEVWFTTENFPSRYGISGSMRSRGTKELNEFGLLMTDSRPVGQPGKKPDFSSERRRKIYILRGDAVAETPPDRPKKVSAKKAK